MRVGRGGVRTSTYWALEAWEHTDDLATTAGTVRELLADAVDRQTVADVPLCSLLSGGLDSSVVSALAAGSLRRRDRTKLATFSVDFTGSADAFTPDQLRPSHDEPFARAAAEHIGSRHGTVTLEAEDLVTAQWAPLAAHDLPTSVSGNANAAEPYAGIWNYYNGTMTVIDSTVAKNSSGDARGGGIYNIGPTLTVIASTISGNSGGGIYSGQGDIAALGATIVADNTGGPNCVAYDTGSLYSAGYNLTNDETGSACGFTAATDLVNKNPLLGPLAANGGPTQTMLPGATSPAADVIPDPVTLRGVAVCPGTDQRGVARPGQGQTRCTIGAAEAGFTNPTTTSVTLSPATVTAGTRVVYLVVVTPKSGTGTPTGTISFTTGSTLLCTAVLSGGVAACGATTAPVGTDKVTGTYSGGDGYASSSGTATLTVKTA